MLNYLKNTNRFIALALSTMLSVSVSAANSSEKPNIVLVLMDNFGYGEVGVYGGGVLRGAPTPNIDSIASEGFQLTNFNVEAECTPSRSALMTGRYGIRTRQQVDTPPAWHLVWPHTMGNYPCRDVVSRRLCNRYVWQVAFR